MADVDMPSFRRRSNNRMSGIFKGISSKRDHVLVPQPSNNPDDPLNWSTWRKSSQLATLIFLSFMQISACVSNLLAFVVQAKVYNRPPVDMSYTASAYLGGLIVGPLIAAPLTHVFGRPAVLFWCCLGQMGCQIWSATMTGEGDYVSFLVSRIFVGLFGCLPPAISPAYIMDVFFLHQRGRLFTLWETVFLFGTIATPTISGFIVDKTSWTWTYWWTIPPLALAALLVFLFMEETNFDRKNETCVRPPSESWIQNRFVTFFMGWKTVPRISMAKLARLTVRPLVIGVSPVSLAPGLFSFILFGFSVMVTLQNSIYLQTPVAEGGYGFTPMRNAYFSFAGWVGVLCAWITGQLLGDRLPLLLARKFNRGVWKPEYRLVNNIIPGIIAPIGLGIYGATLGYHLPYMVLALGYFLVAYTALLCVPVNINYVCECFVDSPIEVGIAFNIWRNALGLGLNFFTEPWAEKVGINWEFGMAAFFVVFAGLLIILVAYKGGAIRRSRIMSGPWKVNSEDGMKIAGNASDIGLKEKALDGSEDE